ncbi:MAG: hypothetical protein IJH48_04435 [Oscillospiraceae bacterium]|nr:hypothetical protein [Oscillospiraceae bacterium]
MKKILSILLLASMLLALAACGAQTAKTNAAAQAVEEGLAKQPETKAPSAEKAPTEEAPAEEAPAEEAPAEEPPAEEPPAEEPPAEEPPAEEAPAEEPATEAEPEAEDMLGKKSGENTYTNRALGIRAEFPSGWVILSDEETAQVMGIVADSFSNEDLADLLRESGSLCDLYAVDILSGLNNVNIMLEDLGAINGIIIKEDSYLDLGVSQLKDVFEQMGLNNVQTEKGSCSFAGGEHATMLISGEINGVRIFERMVLIKTGRYMATITATSQDADKLDEIMAFFAPYGD